MTSALETAKYLIQLAAAEDEPEQLSHLRIQKLLYYVQGWSLAMRGKPMFREQIEAWVHGPVVASLYKRFADYGFGSIDPAPYLEKTSLAAADQKFIRSVWKAYKGYSAASLREMTHKEDPWLKTRGNLPADAACHNTISHDLMRTFFSSQSE